jgi:hypothetical protein
VAKLDNGEVFAGDFLEHFGVRGMRWGRRKDKGNSALGSIEDTGIKIKAEPGKIEVSGGRGRMPHDDAVQAAAYRQIVKASSTHALSNKELQALVTRINLEQNFARATAPTSGSSPKAKAANWVADKVKKVGNMFIDTAANIKVTEMVNQAMGTEQKKAASQARIAALAEQAKKTAGAGK